MTPVPSSTDLIETVRADAEHTDPLGLLATASQTIAELDVVADAVLTHFVDECRRAGHSWTEISAALGVTKQAAHKRFSLAAASVEGYSLERFTPRARNALGAAVDAARTLGHTYVGTEHLLLGLFEPSGGIAARILAEEGITRAEVENRIVAVVPRGKVIATAGEPSLTPLATQSMESAVAAALSLGHNYVGTEHILLALFDPEGLAAQILTDLGATVERCRAMVIEKLSGYRKRP